MCVCVGGGGSLVSTMPVFVSTMPVFHICFSGVFWINVHSAIRTIQALQSPLCYKSLCTVIMRIPLNQVHGGLRANLAKSFYLPNISSFWPHCMLLLNVFILIACGKKQNKSGSSTMVVRLFSCNNARRGSHSKT